MDTRLRAFVAVADHRGFGRAAEQLRVTQPALTKQVQALERELGGVLFTRGRHGATLTGFGAVLLPRARALVIEAEEFARHARRLSSGTTGRLTVGFGLSTIDSAPRAVAAFRRKHPEVDVSLEDLPSKT